MVAAAATTPDSGTGLTLSSSPDTSKLLPIREYNGQLPQPSDIQRRGSFGFLRRGRSGEALRGNRSRSRSRLSKSQHREPSITSPRAPQLPNLAPQPQLKTIAGNSDVFGFTTPKYRNQSPFTMTDSKSLYSSPPARIAPVSPHPPSSPPTTGLAEPFDPYAGTMSMTNRGRESYATSTMSTINSPRRIRRRKDPTHFNILVIGAKNAGKTSFVNFLRSSVSGASRLQDGHFQTHAGSLHPAFQSNYLETEIDGERIGLTIWDSEGLEKSVADLQLREMAAFVDSKFEQTFSEEMKVIRAPGIADPHIHCAILILDPARLDMNLAEANKNSNAEGIYNKATTTSKIVGALDADLDLQVLRTLQGKTTIIPVIGKADTVTATHMAALKKAVWESLKQADIALEALGLDSYGPENDDDYDDNDDVIDEADEDEVSDVESYSNDSVGHDEVRASEKSLPHSPSGSSNDSNVNDAHDEFSTSDHGHLAVKHGDMIQPGSPSTSASTDASTDSPLLPSRSKEGSIDSAAVPFLPMSVLSPDSYEPGAVGRKFPWGFADPYNLDHCDFRRLHESVFHDWRAELKEASREQWYESWRTERLSAGRAL
ncbi:hypothetical protein L228DRAFT_28079 [Xylona heveae TC161]|uniref:Septin-type G domain-containing protein n=1 Tax=Xylona heveae (strain CBS 132557 / TC161) TaxID=1328760 RepID=A0A165AGU5_XYLHT|nr:hypothetical protein L228DRAFT_28079 [Xylona heveae TC161]KZF20449.1 hypothetical protein L228DRAFT_28079 [Xylona heveae TC161]